MRLKIVLINNGLAGGGTERASVGFAHYLLEQGCDVSILALYKSEHFYWLNPDIQFIEPDFIRTQHSTYGYIVNMMFFVRRHIKSIKPDTVLSYNEWTNAYVLLACAGLNIPVYVSERMHPNAKLPLPTELLRKWLYPKASGVIAQTKFGKKVIEQRTGAKNVIAIPNAVNVMDPIDVPKKKQVLAVGRLEPVKGHRYLVEAFAKVDDNSWELCIVGDGSQMDSLKTLAKELGVLERISFKGHLVDFKKELSESEIYVLPSVKEGFPNSLIEAMSLPLACISGDFYEGEHDLVQDGINGLLVPTCDSNALASAINELISNEVRRTELKNEAVKVRQLLAFDEVAIKLKKFILNE